MEYYYCHKPDSKSVVFVYGMKSKYRPSLRVTNGMVTHGGKGALFNVAKLETDAP